MLRKLVVVGLVGIVSFAANIATADDAVGPSASIVGASDVNFTDGASALPATRLNLNVDEGDGARFADLGTPFRSGASNDDRSRRYEVSLTARAAAGMDVSIAHRGVLGFNDGDMSRSHGSELRLGRALHNRRSSSTPSWYLFAASEDQALVWQPGQRNDFGGAAPAFALQDRVDVGDRQAGLTYEVHGIQASLAYVERRIRYRSGSQRFGADENFAGLTITMRH